MAWFALARVLFVVAVAYAAALLQPLPVGLPANVAFALVLAAIASSVRNRVIPTTTAMFGEVGLAGEVRGIAQAALRVREASQMGFRRCIMPEANVSDSAGPTPNGECELVGVRTVGEALDAMLG